MNYLALSILIVLFLIGSIFSYYELMKRIPMMKQKKKDDSDDSPFD